jgi:hypothetical protein
MATAEVLVLRSLPTGDVGPGSPPDAPPSPGAPPDAPRPDTAWPASWLPELLAREQEEATADDGVHRYRGARALYSAGCRWIDVTAAPSDPTTVRLTVVWGEAAPSAEDRAAFVDWWTTASARAGWEPADADDLVGDVVVTRYVPTDRRLEDVEPPVLLHDWDVPVRPRGDSSRTSGRRT